MTAKDLMSKGPFWCEATEDAQAVAKLMREHNVGILPVLEDADSRQVVGVVTDRDLCVKIIAAGLDPRFTSVRECMTVDAVCCRPTDVASRVLSLMATNRVRRIPVVDSRRRLMGIVSIEDVVRGNAVAPAIVCDAMKRIFRPAAAVRSPLRARAS